MTASEERFTRQALLDVQPLTPNLFALRTSRDAGFRFCAGQFARLGMYKPSGSIVWCAYSMVSASHGESLDFFSIVVPDGEFTSEFGRLREGDQLLVDRRALGFLTPDRFMDGHDLWLLATGIGVVPFVPILQDSEAWEYLESIKLVYSVRESKELAHRELIAGFAEREYLAEHAYELQLIPVMTREQVPGCPNGRITMLIENGDLERTADLELIPEHSQVMLCGNPQMVEDTRAVLKVRGMDLSLTRRPGQVAVENYWQVCIRAVVADSAAARPVVR